MTQRPRVARFRVHDGGEGQPLFGLQLLVWEAAQGVGRAAQKRQPTLPLIPDVGQSVAVIGEFAPDTPLRGRRQLPGQPDPCRRRPGRAADAAGRVRRELCRRLRHRRPEQRRGPLGRGRARDFIGYRCYDKAHQRSAIRSGSASPTPASSWATWLWRPPVRSPTATSPLRSRRR